MHRHLTLCLLFLCFVSMVQSFVFWGMHLSHENLGSLNPKPRFPPVPRKSMRWPRLKTMHVPPPMHRLLRKPWYSRREYTATLANATESQNFHSWGMYSDFINSNLTFTQDENNLDINCSLDNDTCTCADVYALEKRMLRAELILQEVISAVLVCDELALLEREVSKSSTYNAALTREEVPKYFKNVLHNITRRYQIAIVPVKTHEK